MDVNLLDKIFSLKISAKQKLVLITIAVRAHPATRLFLSLDMLGKDCSLSAPALNKTLEKLQEAHLLTLEVLAMEVYSGARIVVAHMGEALCLKS